MPITRCPNCQANLEVPAMVPGGMVACPYCETEFAVKTGGGGRSRRGGRDRDDYDDEGYGYGRPRKRVDPMPIVILVIAVVVIGGLGIFFYVKHSEGTSEAERSFLASIASKEEAGFELGRAPDAPQGDPIELYCDFRVGDLLTVMDLSYTSGLTVRDNDGKEKDLYGKAYRVRCEEHDEKIVSAEADGRSTHEGRYEIQSFLIAGRTIIPSPVWMEARFKTGRRGNLIPGSFERTGGATVTPTPEFLAERGFGILPDHAVRKMETWGAANLTNPFSPYIDIEGKRIEQIPLAGTGRQGGWRIQAGSFEKREDGSWTRNANAELRLFAYENRRLDNTTFLGQPASITVGTRWRGKAFYELMKNYVSRLENVTTEVWVVVKTARAWWEWKGLANLSYQMYKDP